MTTPETSLDEKRERVERLREQVAQAKADAEAKLTERNDDVESRNLDDEEARLTRELLLVKAEHAANDADAQTVVEAREAAHAEEAEISVAEGSPFVTAPGDGPGFQHVTEARAAEQADLDLSLDGDGTQTVATTDSGSAPVVNSTTPVDSGVEVSGTDLQAGSNDNLGFDADNSEGR